MQRQDLERMCEVTENFAKHARKMLAAEERLPESEVRIVDIDDASTMTFMTALFNTKMFHKY